MLPIIIISLLPVISLSVLTTLPFTVAILVIFTVFFKKPWVFFLAFGLGLLLDSIMIRVLGYTSLVLTIFVFIFFIYERKFETRTVTFVFISTFLGSVIYLWLFGYQMVFLQAFVSALAAVVFFRVILNTLSGTLLVSGSHIK